MQCQPLRSEAARTALRDTYAPACYNASAFLDGRGSPWSLESNDTRFDLSVVARGSRFYGVMPDRTSLIGLRRERPATVRDVPWWVLAELFAHLGSTARRDDGSPATPLPASIGGMEFETGAGVGRQAASADAAPGRGRAGGAPTSVRLSTLVDKGLALYVNGNTRAFDAHVSPLRRELMLAVDETLTVADVGEAMGVRPWISAGGTESGLHFDYSDAFHCSTPAASASACLPRTTPRSSTRWSSRARECPTWRCTSTRAASCARRPWATRTART